MKIGGSFFVQLSIYLMKYETFLGGKMEKNKNKMASGKLLPLIVSMSLPPIFSMLIQSMYNIVDSMFVAKVSNDALTAVSLVFPIQNLILALSVGFGIGINSYVSRKMGQDNYLDANKAATHGVVISILHYFAVVVLGLLFAKPFLGLFTTNLEILELGYSYTLIIILFSFGQSVQIAIEKILQACGNMVAPMFFQLIGAITNIILDPIFIFGWFGVPAMGVKGAAIATVIGQIFAMIAAVSTLVYRKQLIKVSFKGFRWESKMVKEMYIISIPSFFLLSIGSFMVSGLNFILSTYSTVAVAVFGVYYKLQSFVYMPISGLIQGTLPIMSFNYGAKNKTRLLETLKISLLISAAVSFLGTVLFWIIPNQIFGLFSSESELLQMGIEALSIISLSFIFGSTCYVFSSYFQATGSNLFSLFVTLLRQFILILPLAFLCSKFLGVMGVWLSFPIAEIVTATLALLLFKYDYSRKQIYRQKEDKEERIISEKDYLLDE